MFASSRAALLALMFFVGARAIAQSPLPDCEAPSAHVELPPEPNGEVLEVCIAPEHATTLWFDSPLLPGAVELQDGELFEDMAMGTRSLLVVPRRGLQPGKRVLVKVRFADGAAPTSATFVLVGHPALAARQVDVFRHKRTVEDYQRELKEKDARLQRLGQEVELLRVEHGPGGLRGMIAAGLLMLGDATGVVAKVLTKGFTRPVDNALFVEQVTSYRSKTTRMEGKPAVVRVAVAMRVINPGPQPWTAKAAALVGKGQEAKRVEVWQPAPLRPNEPGLVVVETELLEEEARGTFTLELWAEGGGRRITLGGVTFP